MRQPRVFTISFKKSAKKYKSSLFLEKSLFSWPLSKQLSVFAKNEKVVLRVTARPKSIEILNISWFS